MKRNRVNRVLENMEKMGLDQLIVGEPASVYYLTGRWIEPGERMLALLISKGGACALFVNRLFAQAPDEDMRLVEFDDTDDAAAFLAEAVAPGRLGVDKAWPSAFLIRLMKKRPGLEILEGSQAVDQARMLKDEEELAALRRSSRLNDQALERTIQAIQPGMSERQIARMYEDNAIALGAMGNSFPGLICFGENCAEPHHETGDRRLKDGDSVILDVGLNLNHAMSDMTRTVFLGRATDEQRRVYDLVLRANEAGRRAARPGIPLSDIDRAARGVIEQAGYGARFIHRTGHGIGLSVHEPPDVSSTNGLICRPGMVFSIEPGVYLPGAFGVRVEDLVAVTEDGAETLNALDRELKII